MITFKTNTFLSIQLSASRSLAFSVTLFCSEACLVILVLLARRSKTIGGELGGPFIPKVLTSAFLFSLWLLYLIMSTLEAYGVIQGF